MEETTKVVEVSGEPLSVEQLKTILDDVAANHNYGRRFSRKGGYNYKHIRHVQATFDARDGKCFFIKFHMFPFHAYFGWTDSNEPMYDRIIAWLNSQ